MAQPTSQLVRVPLALSAGAGNESDDEEFPFDITPSRPGTFFNNGEFDDKKGFFSGVADAPDISQADLYGAGGPQPMGPGADLLTSPFGYSSQLPSLLVPPYYLPLTQQIHQLQQQNQLQQQIIRQQQHQQAQAARQLQDLQVVQQHQQLAQLQHEQLQRERARPDPLQQLRDGLHRQDHLRQPLSRLANTTSTSPPSAGCQPTSTLHQVHSVGPSSAGSQLPPVSTQLWNFSLLGADPYMPSLADETSAAMALQSYYHNHLAAQLLVTAATDHSSLAVPGMHHPASTDTLSPATHHMSPAVSPLMRAPKHRGADGNHYHEHDHEQFDDEDVKLLGRVDSDDDGPMHCEWADCRLEFPGSKLLAEHVRKVHCRADGAESEFVCRWATCKRQLKPFPIPQQFLRHMQTHTREKPYPCKHPGCGQTFTQANVLAAHMRTHTGEKPYCCNVAGCGKRFAYANCLLAHTRSHTGEKPRVCKVCGKGFSGLSNLTAHMRTHTGERPYECRHEGCGKSFTTSSDLVRHTRIHTGQKPFACKIADCNKRFTTSSQLNNHLRTHTGERPYPCKTPGCDKRFADLTTLRRHEQSHERKRKVERDTGDDHGDGSPGYSGMEAAKRARMEPGADGSLFRLDMDMMHHMG